MKHITLDKRGCCVLEISKELNLSFETIRMMCDKHYLMDTFILQGEVHLSFENKACDYIIIGNEFSKYLREKSFVSELKRILHPEGELIIIDSDRRNVEILEKADFIVDYNQEDGLMICRKPSVMLGKSYKETINKKDNSFDVFHKLALLGSYHISFAKTLEMINMKSVYIYGFGEIGQILYRLIKDEIKIEAIIDKGRAKIESSYEGVKVISPDELPEDEIAIIVTPSAHVRSIIWQLMKDGVERKRLWSFQVLLDIALKYGENNSYQMDYSKQFLITGAVFENKGAQAMLFTAISEIRRRFPGAIIWYLPNGGVGAYTEKVMKQYNILFLLDSLFFRSQIYEMVHNLTAIVDVSGYALAPHFKNDKIIPISQMAYDYNIPIYFMPQSFGPLDFSEEVHAELGRLLPTAKAIFAREQQGYNEMKEKYHLNNIHLSYDLVLQNRGIDLNNIYTEEQDLSKYRIDDENTVAIVPNTKTYVFGDKAMVLDMYRAIIDYLISQDKKVYIICHSNDEEVSNDIYAMYSNHDAVVLYNQKFDCIGYSALIQNFEFAIASRYHAIVHAFKEGIPCVAIGWAEKYIELLNNFKQNEYVFDVRNEICIEDIVSAVAQMNMSHQKEAEKIKEILPEFQKENCFDILSEID